MTTASTSTTSSRLTEPQAVRDWLLDHFDITGTFAISEDGFVSIDGDANVKISKRDSLSELLIAFASVTGDFRLSGCTALTALKGCPEQVGGEFTVYGCKQLTTLAGAPLTAGTVTCTYCTNLVTLANVPTCRELWMAGVLCPLPIEQLSRLDEIVVNYRAEVTPAEFQACIKHQIAISNTSEKATPPWQTVCNDYYRTSDLLTAISEYERLMGVPFQLDKADATLPEGPLL